MKSNAPWSVKGIERDARETAKEAAKRNGMTVGEWLNQMIYTAGDPEDTGGDVEGLKLRDVVTAIDHLHKRIADSAKEHTGAVTEMTSKMGDVVERVQRLERTKPSGEDRERIHALKALEKAVSQVAVQFSNAQQATHERLNASEQSLKELTSKMQSGAKLTDDGGLQETINELSSRVERAEQLASGAVDGHGGDAEFIESTSNRLRVLGDEIKRGGDQIRALETTIGKLSHQIEAAERRSAEGVQKTAETLADLRDKLTGDYASDSLNKDEIAAAIADQTRDTVKRVDHLQGSFEKMIAKLDSLGVAAPQVKENAERDVVSDASFEDVAALEEDDEHDPFADLEPIEDETTGQTSETAPADDASLQEDPQSDDDDIFSFADDIDASIEDTLSSERDEEFSFELDDENAEEREKAAALLSEVQDVFSGKNPSQPDTEASSDEKGSVDAELDELLAGLDETSDDTTDDTIDDTAETEAVIFGKASPRNDDQLSDEDNDDNDDIQESLVESIRRKARAEADAASTQEKSNRPTRRNLTPKQKAILAARAKQKRQAEQARQEEHASEEGAPTPKNIFAKSTSGPTFDEDGDDDAQEERKGGLFASLRAKLPFLGRSQEAETEDHASEESDSAPQDGDQEALETLTKTASSRPVTLALGVGIFLALGLLFFMVKDFVFPPSGNESPRPLAQVENPAAAPAAEPTLEAPAAPTIDPKTLYQDAMTGLNAADNEAETAIAVQKLEQAALLGHPPAQLQLGELYKTGQGVDQDIAQARIWFRRAANGGNVLAMHRIGVMTARGEGGSANTPEAIGWFEQAANRGLVDSQYNLGAIYHPSGEAGADPSGLQDAGKAYYWYSLASKNGDDQATPLAAGIGASLSDSQRGELDVSIASWEAIPADAEANTLAVNG